MQRLKKIFFLPEFYCILLLALCLIFLHLGQVKIENAIYSRASETESIFFPFAKNIFTNAIFFGIKTAQKWLKSGVLV